MWCHRGTIAIILGSMRYWRELRMEDEGAMVEIMMGFKRKPR